MSVSRRGLTLLEVLAAAVLLTTLAGACVPLLSDAAGRLAAMNESGNEASFDSIDLAQFADSVLSTPDAYRIDSLTELYRLDLAWPEAPARSPVTITQLRDLSSGSADGDDDSSEITHAWLSFACEDHLVIRWLSLETGEDDADAEPATGGDEEAAP